jgi:WD40 repeat protein
MSAVTSARLRRPGALAQVDWRGHNVWLWVLFLVFFPVLLCFYVLGKIESLHIYHFPVRSVSFSPDGRRLVSGSKGVKLGLNGFEERDVVGLWTVGAWGWCLATFKVSCGHLSARRK